jgi:hypothetical protein
MASSITWLTTQENLGTIPEEIFYSTSVRAIDPDDRTKTMNYQIIAGELPGGIRITKVGIIEGVPNGDVLVQGIPFALSENITSKFVIRAFTQKQVGGQTVVDKFADRTFTLTIAGQSVPFFATPEGLIATFSDASPASVQVEFFDRDLDDTPVASIASGFLPPGLILNPLTGVISGIIPEISASTLYEFSIGITDGKSSALRNFSIQVNRSDETRPFIKNASPSNIGTFRSNNYFAYRFDGFDFGERPSDVDFLEYLVIDSPGFELPPGLQLDSKTGWLYGNLPDLGLTEIVYRFKIQVRERIITTNVSPIYDFSIKIIGNVDTDVEWLSPENLGVINNGETSTLFVEAVTTNNDNLKYRLAAGGDYNKLPQGLRLLDNGEISGRTSFNTFSLDNNTTVFDSQTRTTVIKQETTFDLTFRFTVNAYFREPDADEDLISVFKTFVITVFKKYNEPYENLYVKAMPPEADRENIQQLLNDPSIFVPELIYRKDDPYFGVAKDVIYEHAFGITPSSIEDYVDALYKNHYWKDLILGSIETAQARDANDNVIYEVVYSRILDELLNAQGQSVKKEIRWPYDIRHDQATITTVYPNSLINMRDQMFDALGQAGTVLPLWMTSKQANGRVLGFTPAWVIAYVKPGAGNQIAYNLRTKLETPLNEIDFTVDRYLLDRTLTRNWNPVTKEWVPTPAETTFDRENHYRFVDDSALLPGGQGYRPGDQILILGTQVGGQAPLNNVLITVYNVDNNGAIINAFCTGTAPAGSLNQVFDSVVGANIETGSGARFRVRRVNLAYLVTVTTQGLGYRTGDTLVIDGSILGGDDSSSDCIITVTEVGLSGNILQISVAGTAAPGVQNYLNVPADKLYGSGATFDLVSTSGETTTFDANSLRFIRPVDNYQTTGTFDKYLVFPKRTILK